MEKISFHLPMIRQYENGRYNKKGIVYYNIHSNDIRHIFISSLLIFLLNFLHSLSILIIFNNAISYL